MYVTPKEIARALGIPAHLVREFLRAKYGRQHERNTRWLLNAKQVVAVTARFS